MNASSSQRSQKYLGQGEACINCAYIARHESRFAQDSKPMRLHSESNRSSSFFWLGTVCFHEQWRAMDGIQNVDTGVFLLEQGDPSPEEIVILDEWRQPVNLSRHKCQFFFPLSELGSKTLGQCSEEQQQFVRDTKERRRFLVNTCIGGITALAVVATAILTWMARS